MSVLSEEPKNLEIHLQTVLREMNSNENMLLTSNSLPAKTIIDLHKKQADLTGAMMWLQNLIQNKAKQAIVKPVSNKIVSLP